MGVVVVRQALAPLASERKNHQARIATAAITAVAWRGITDNEGLPVCSAIGEFLLVKRQSRARYGRRAWELADFLPGARLLRPRGVRQVGPICYNKPEIHGRRLGCV